MSTDTVWSIRLSTWKSGWQWDLCSSDGRVLPYRTAADGVGLWALRPTDPTGTDWAWTCLQPSALWPTTRAAMRRALHRHYGLVPPR